MNTGWKTRLNILQENLERKFLTLAKVHGWKITSTQEYEIGEYIITEIERNEKKHKFAFLYTAATSNNIYKLLDQQVESIYLNGGHYQTEQFAYGIKTPVKTEVEFQQQLTEWNEDSSAGQFLVSPGDGIEPLDLEPRPEYHQLLSEQPIDAIWLRLNQLKSITMAKKLVIERLASQSKQLSEEAIQTKSEGVAFSLRNASDYFLLKGNRNISQRILNLYYGTMSFAFAEMLASPNGPNNLKTIEESTKQGHGLYTVDGKNDGLENLVVGVCSNGFFPTYMKFLSLELKNVPSAKPRSFVELEKVDVNLWITIEDLFATIPEMGNLFTDIFDSPPRWAIPSLDMEASPLHSRKSIKETHRTYASIIDLSARMKIQDIAKLSKNLKEISEINKEQNGRIFRAAIDHPTKDLWWNSLQVHKSPFVTKALIQPIFSEVRDYRAICFVFLYSLSIIVRYRPSLWRRVQGGDLDHMYVLIEAFLEVMERVLPEQFLEEIVNRKVHAKQPGSIF